MTKLVYLLLTSLLLLGCSMWAPTNVRLIPVSYERVDSFRVGEVQEKTVGDILVSRVDGLGYKGMVVPSTFNPPANQQAIITFPLPAIMAGSEWAVIGQLGDGSYLLSMKPPQKVYGEPYSWEYCLVMDSKGVAYGDAGCTFANGGSVNVRRWSAPNPGLLRPKSGLIYKEGSIRQELVYNGKSKDAIKFQYREYKNDFARPAFYQELSYDLSESRTIAFRSMLIEVVEATNSNIKFIVRKGLQ